MERLTAGYDRWLAEVSASRGYHPVRFAIGSDRQPHVTLTRQDWRMVTADGWGRDQPVLGHWEVECLSAGPYDVTVTLPNPAAGSGTVRIAFRGIARSLVVEPGTEQVRFEDVRLEPGAGTFEASLATAADLVGAWQVDLVRR